MSIIYDMPDTAYHAANGIGASQAKLFLESPQLYHDAISGVLPKKDRPAFQVGKLAHMAVLEPDRFARQVTGIGPINAKTGAPYGRDTKAFQEWQSANPDTVVVDPWIQVSLARMPDPVCDIVRSGVNECSVFTELPALGLTVKCRPDTLHVAEGQVYDLKTIEDIHKAERQIAALSYWFSAGWYRMVLKAETQRLYGYSFIFMEKHAPYRWRIIRMSDAYLDLADEKVDAVLGDLSTCYRTQNWRDTGELVHVADPPQWLNPDTFTQDEDGINL